MHLANAATATDDVLDDETLDAGLELLYVLAVHNEYVTENNERAREGESR